MNASQFDTHNQDWEDMFRQLFDRAVTTYEAGTRELDLLFSREDSDFLASIGATPQEIYDFVEDWSDDGEPTPDVIRQITGVRREYFLSEQNGKHSSRIVASASLPSPQAFLGEHRWLPRIIEKARAKLRGELPPDIMYGCGMDRPFLRRINIHLSEFLRVVWKAGDNREEILEYVNKKSNQS